MLLKKFHHEFLCGLCIPSALDEESSTSPSFSTPQPVSDALASSRRTDQERDYLQGLGADEIIDARELSGAGSRMGEMAWQTALRRSAHPGIADG